MRFEEGATVLTADGEKVGTISQIVVEPEDRDVTHLVVKEGMLLTTDSLVPVDDVESTSEDAVVLKAGTAPKQFDPFVAHRFSTNDAAGRAPIGAPGFVLYPITGVPSPAPAATPGAVTPEEAAPEAPEGVSTAMIEEGTPVLSEDSRRLGTVEQIITREGGEIGAFVVKSGMWIFARRRVIPVGWIREIRSGEIRLNVTKQQALIQAEQPTESIGQRPPGR